MSGSTSPDDPESQPADDPARAQDGQRQEDNLGPDANAIRGPSTPEFEEARADWSTPLPAISSDTAMSPDPEGLPEPPERNPEADQETDPEPSPARLTIIIPTLNAATDLPRALESITAAEPATEIVVVDGASGDGTRRIAEAYGVRFLKGPRGRGTQLHAGAQAASGDWLLFLHADSSLQLGWHLIARGFMGDPANRLKAGYFSLILDDTARAARRVENLANWRAKHLGLPYGDQGLLISRQFYNHLGGYARIPLMEDVDLARRIGARRLVSLPSAIATSARRYRKNGYWLRPLRNLLCLSLFYLGLPPRLIERLYR